MIENGMRIIEQQTRVDNQDCIKFIRNKNAKSFIQIFNDKGSKSCYSNIGRLGGPQKLSLYFDDPNSCVKQSIIIHELMHSLGFPHEHSRPDRLKWIKIFRENIIESKLY